MRLPFTVVRKDDTTVEDTAKSLDVLRYEDHFRCSWDATGADDQGNLTSSGFWRLIWVVLRARHGETRPFDDWLAAMDDDEFACVLGHTSTVEQALDGDQEAPGEPDPTSEAPTRRDADSPASPPAADSTPDGSSTSPNETTDSSKPSSSKSSKPKNAVSPSGTG